MTQKDFAAHIGVTPETLSRWARGRVPMRLVARRYCELLNVHKGAIDEVLTMLRAFYTDEQAWQWLRSPQPLLGYRKPLALLAKGEIDPVLSLLRQLDDSVYL